jgi:hypothetical protein
MEKSEMNLHVQPTKALVDQPVDICVSDLPANGKVKISASYRLPWAKDVLWESFAWFTADAVGRVDLSQQKPESGSYDFIDCMGLIASVQSQDPKALEKITRNISVEESLFIEITAECDQERESVQLERFFKTPEIQRQKIAGEFVGEFFFSDNPNNKTILWLGGSGSSLAVNALVCAPLASHGFNVLGVPFFGEKGLPDQLSRVPLEQIEKALAWLQTNPLTAGKEIQVLGMSKGAEAALLLASFYPVIQRLVVWAPHAYCFQGIAFKNESSWTYQGQDLPYIHMKNRWILADMLGCMIKNKPFAFTNIYRKGLANANNKEEARIKIENAQADLLMMTSTECGMWNTYDGSVEIMETLRKCHYPHRYDLIVYENAGEPYLVPYVIPVGLTSSKMMPRLVLSIGGTLEGNHHARTDAWEKTIAYLGQA